MERGDARENPLCTFDESDQLVLSGVQNVALARGDAVDVANGYQQSSSNNVNTLADYIPERSAYDAEYASLFSSDEFASLSPFTFA